MGSRTSTLLLVAVGIATVGAYVTMFLLDTTRDRPDTLDLEPTRDAASVACTTLRTGLDNLPVLAPTASQADRLARLQVQQDAVAELVRTVRAVGPDALARDVPAEQWLADWAALAQAREAYAAAGATGPFSPPVADGRPISDRMTRIGVPACVVPQSLLVAP